MWGQWLREELKSGNTCDLLMDDRQDFVLLGKKTEVIIENVL